ncbi:MULTISPECIES: helix-turn-helix transcriptional regulator [unclassified Pseudoalteromonas]|uniref:helix-turn-helix transcriptional regulator n=1 Tax=unclassified Pseudoalteromonas TaxID=194690 RepID=UPI001CB879C8|nr:MULTISPECIES: AlpA family phage regulatory protein [unclassified Pseudoalteromonas]MDC9499833.1 AlpA family phage regulatory protein [Pseudoalteromonas sp. Angola-20]MDC9519424.1 AlpA family phage regulatory protein [Pseudoalteromonas sp. Angola-22]MDC9535829.1 AlpA family phage regulatory protein [Pseudoalteromonas sp. Angola-9]
MNSKDKKAIVMLLDNIELRSKHTIYELQHLVRQIDSIKKLIKSNDVQQPNYEQIKELVQNETLSLRPTSPNDLVRREEVINMTGLSRSTIYTLMKNSEFPLSIKLSERSVAWRRGDIQNWISNKIASKNERVNK